MPLASDADDTETVSAAGLTPELGLTDSQLLPTSVFAVAVHPSVLDKLLSTWNVWLVGLLPRLAMNCSEPGANDIAEDADWITVRVTNSVCGVLPAPLADTWIAPL